MNTSAVQPEGSAPVAPARYYGVGAEPLDVSAKWGIGELVIYRIADETIVARWRLEDMVVRGAWRGAIPAVSVRGSAARLVVVSPELRAELGRVAYLSALVAPPSWFAWRIVRFFKSW